MTTAQHITAWIFIMFTVYGALSAIEDIAKFIANKYYN